MNTPAQPLTLGPEIWSDDTKLRRVFTWLTRIGAAPKFGTLPIVYYQQDQCDAIDALETAMKVKGIAPNSPLRFTGGLFYARSADHGWTKFAMLITGKIIVR